MRVSPTRRPRPQNLHTLRRAQFRLQGEGPGHRPENRAHGALRASRPAEERNRCAEPDPDRFSNPRFPRRPGSGATSGDNRKRAPVNDVGIPFGVPVIRSSASPSVSEPLALSYGAPAAPTQWSIPRQPWPGWASVARGFILLRPPSGQPYQSSDLRLRGRYLPREPEPGVNDAVPRIRVWFP